jgi:hypothetical protein
MFMQLRDLYQSENCYLHGQPPQANMWHFALYNYTMLSNLQYELTKFRK